MSYQPRNPVPLSECLPDVLKPERVRAILDRPFPPEAIKSRPGNFGQILGYVEAHEYIRRFNEAFGVAWSFHVVQHEVMENEVLVLGKLAAALRSSATEMISPVSRTRVTWLPLKAILMKPNAVSHAALEAPERPLLSHVPPEPVNEPEVRATQQARNATARRLRRRSCGIPPWS